MAPSASAPARGRRRLDAAPPRVPERERAPRPRPGTAPVGRRGPGAAGREEGRPGPALVRPPRVPAPGRARESPARGACHTGVEPNLRARLGGGDAPGGAAALGVRGEDDGRGESWGWQRRADRADAHVPEAGSPGSRAPTPPAAWAAAEPRRRRRAESGGTLLPAADGVVGLLLGDVPRPGRCGPGQRPPAGRRVPVPFRVGARAWLWARPRSPVPGGGRAGGSRLVGLSLSPSLKPMKVYLITGIVHRQTAA